MGGIGLVRTVFVASAGAPTMPRRELESPRWGSACETQRDDGEACAVRARTVVDVHTLGQTGRGFNMLASLQPKELRTTN